MSRSRKRAEQGFSYRTGPRYVVRSARDVQPRPGSRPGAVTISRWWVLDQLTGAAVSEPSRDRQEAQRLADERNGVAPNERAAALTPSPFWEKAALHLRQAYERRELAYAWALDTHPVPTFRAEIHQRPLYAVTVIYHGRWMAHATRRTADRALLEPREGKPGDYLKILRLVERALQQDLAAAEGAS